MKKRLKITINKESVEVSMDSNQMLEQFDDMLNKIAHDMIRAIGGYNSNMSEFEDCKQLCSMKALEKFETYDYEKGVSFSTLLFKALRGIVVDEVRKCQALMRNTESVIVNINKEIGENGETLSNVIADTKEDTYFLEDANELERFLFKNLTKEQILFYTIDLKKKLGKASSSQRHCLESTIDVFTRFVGGFVPDKKEELAEVLGISRPTLNKRIKEARKSVNEVAEEFCLSNMELTEIPF